MSNLTTGQALDATKPSEFESYVVVLTMALLRKDAAVADEACQVLNSRYGAEVAQHKPLIYGLATAVLKEFA